MAEITRAMRAVYDGIAKDFADRDAAVTSEFGGFREQFLRMVDGGGPLLDLGCGPGRDLGWFADHGVLAVGFDLSAGMLEQARQRTNAPLVQGDMKLLPFAQAAFPRIWCSASLLHLPKEHAVLAVSEMARVLRPGGALYLAIQRGATEGWEEGRFAGVERYFARYSQDEARGLLTRCGFTVDGFAETATPTTGWLNFFARRSTEQ